MNKIKKMIVSFIFEIKYILSGNVKKFNNNIYKNKRIIVVGPAETALTYMHGDKVDEFDYVIRVNKSPLSLGGKENFLGRKTDILYHCFNEDPIRGGGEINIKKLKEQFNQYVVYTYAEPTLEIHFRKVVLKKKDYFFYRTDANSYWNLKREYTANIPSTGIQAINHIMGCDFKELHITGFTFFKSSYVQGYVSGVETAKEVRELAESGGNHNADSEEQLFKEIYKKNKNKCIFLDDFLKKIVAEFR